MYGLDLFVMIVFAVFYYRVGVLEYGSGIVWALLSVLLSLLMTNLLDAGGCGSWLSPSCRSFRHDLLQRFPGKAAASLTTIRNSGHPLPVTVC